MGKSTLINSLFFEKGSQYVKHAQEGSMDATTVDVTPHTLKWKGVSYNIYDSQGLQDGKEDDTVYFAKMSDKCPKIHLIIYCTKMGEPVRPEEAAALENITTSFGEAIWENVVIALTFANKVEPADPDKDEVEYFAEILRDKKELLCRHFAQIPIQRSLVDMLATRIFPVGSARALELPGMEQDWRANFWLGCLDACQAEGKGALLKLAWKNRHFVMKALGASVGGGSVSMVAGVGCVVAGGVLTATGILAPVGVPLIAAGIVTSLLGVGATVGGATGIKAIKREHKTQK